MASVVNKPFGFRVRTQSLLKRTFALSRKRVRDHALRMRDVREMADPNFRFGGN